MTCPDCKITHEKNGYCDACLQRRMNEERRKANKLIFDTLFPQEKKFLYYDEQRGFYEK